MPGPTPTGETGLYRSVSVRGLPSGGFSVGETWEYFSVQNALGSIDPGLSYNRLDQVSSVTLGLSDWSEFAVSVRSIEGTLRKLSDPSGATTRIESFGDPVCALKLGFPTAGGFGMGVDGFVRFLSPLGDMGPAADATSFGGRLLWSYDPYSVSELPFRLNVNLGYSSDHSRYLLPPPYATDPATQLAAGILYDDQVLGALSVEIPVDLRRYGAPLDGVSFYLEYSTEQTVDADSTCKPNGPVPCHVRTYAQNPQRLTPGVRFQAIRGLNVDVAVPIGLSQRLGAADLAFPDGTGAPGGNPNLTWVPPFAIVAGVNFTFLPGSAVSIQKEVGPPPPPPRGKVAGRVVNDKTGAPLGRAVVAMIDTGLTNLSTDPVTGGFVTPPLPLGAVELDVAHKGFHAQRLKINVAAGPTAPLEVRLKEIVQIGAFAGRVSDPQGKPLAAVLTFEPAGSPPVPANPATGDFFVKLTPGTYRATASATGYKSRSLSITVKNRVKTTFNFILEPETPTLPY